MAYLPHRGERSGVAPTDLRILPRVRSNQISQPDDLSLQGFSRILVTVFPAAPGARCLIWWITLRKRPFSQ